MFAQCFKLYVSVLNKNHSFKIVHKIQMRHIAACRFQLAVQLGGKI